MKHRTCPDCGASLDPNERCDCRDKKEGAPAATGTPSGGNDWRRDSTCILADPYQDVKNLLRLKEIREETGSMAKDVAMVVREKFPGFNRQLLSQCERWEQYGIIIHPDGLRLICEAYDMPLPDTSDEPVEVKVEDPAQKKTENRKLDRKFTLRTTVAKYSRIQRIIEKKGYKSMQDWFNAMLDDLLGGEDGV